MTEKQSSEIREYSAEEFIFIGRLDTRAPMGSQYDQEHKDQRLVIEVNAYDHSSISIDLIDILKHVKQDMPELWESI